MSSSVSQAWRPHMAQNPAPGSFLYEQLECSSFFTCLRFLRFFMLNKTVKVVSRKKLFWSRPKIVFWSPAFVWGPLGYQIVGGLSISTGGCQPFVFVCVMCMHVYAYNMCMHLYGGRSITGERMGCYMNWVWSVRLQGIHWGYLRDSLPLLWGSSQRTTGRRTSST